jgi:hypothetical protein
MVDGYFWLQRFPTVYTRLRRLFTPKRGQHLIISCGLTKPPSLV